MMHDAKVYLVFFNISVLLGSKTLLAQSWPGCIHLLKVMNRTSGQTSMVNVLGACVNPWEHIGHVLSKLMVSANQHELTASCTVWNGVQCARIAGTVNT
jgi:hypothetical protein